MSTDYESSSSCHLCKISFDSKVQLDKHFSLKLHSDNVSKLQMKEGINSSIPLTTSAQVMINHHIPVIKQGKAICDNEPFSDYTEEHVGSGSFGEVFKCFDRHSQSYFAMKKVLISSGKLINSYIESLKNEIKIYQALSHHPRIVHFLGCKQDPKALYILMEYINGGSIEEKCNKNGPLHIDLISKYIKQILEGLIFLHGNKIIHRDIKGANILLDYNDDIKISDFGTSRLLRTISINSVGNKNDNFCTGNEKKKVMATTFCGTPNFMAPEIINGEPYDYPADVWSLGATIIEMLTGHPPYYEREKFSVIFIIGTTKKIDYKSSVQISLKMENIIDQMLLPNSGERPTAKDLLGIF